MLPPPLQLGITLIASLCITAAHYRQSANFSNGLLIKMCLKGIGLESVDCIQIGKDMV
jgi:hypothetical protein